MAGENVGHVAWCVLVLERVARAERVVTVDRAARASTGSGAPRRIIFVVESLHVGGTEVQATRLAAELAERGHQVKLIAVQGGGPLEAVVARLGRLPGGVRPQSRPGAAARWTWPGRSSGCGGRCAARHPDVVQTYAHWPGMLALPMAWVHARAPAHRGTPHVVGGAAVPHPAPVVAPRALAPVRLLRARELPAGCRRHRPSRRDAPAAKVSVIENGLDLPEVRADVGHQPPTGVMVARMRPEKAHLDLVRAMALIDEPPTIRLIGDGSERGAVVALAAELGVADKLVLEGALDHAGDAFAGAQFGLLTSHNEGLPNAVLGGFLLWSTRDRDGGGWRPRRRRRRGDRLLVPPRRPCAGRRHRPARDRPAAAPTVGCRRAAGRGLLRATASSSTRRSTGVPRDEPAVAFPCRQGPRCGSRSSPARSTSGARRRRWCSSPTSWTVAGTRVRIFVLKGGGPLTANVAAHGLVAESWDFDGFRSRQPLRTTWAIVRAGRSLRQFRPDVVHADLESAYLLGIPMAWLLRVPVRVSARRALGEGQHYRRLGWWLHRMSVRGSSAPDRELGVGRRERDRGRARGPGEGPRHRDGLISPPRGRRGGARSPRDHRGEPPPREEPRGPPAGPRHARLTAPDPHHRRRR